MRACCLLARQLRDFEARVPKLSGLRFQRHLGRCGSFISYSSGEKRVVGRSPPMKSWPTLVPGESTIYLYPSRGSLMPNPTAFRENNSEASAFGRALQQATSRKR